MEEIFAKALALPIAERRAWLGAACAREPELRAEVEGLLRSHETGGFMQDVAVSPEIEAEFARLRPELAGDRIGHYKLLEQIGEGGFGTVWVAEQEHPIRRRVALKIIKLGMDTKEVVARFEQERQALAMMDHPNIAKVLDAGATPVGRPFFVMEFVRGIRITDYCDQAKLSTVDRLKLFISVCQAVQHAHQKGIIHRDLKPPNILVTLHDGVPVPKVIDFGVAKATQQQRLTDLTVYTQFEQMIGTPLYMSPEQAEMSGLDIDTRTDIYSLGVLLYELLTGRTPFDPEELMRRGLDEIRRAIRELEPQKPSTALQTMGVERRTSVARQHQSDGARLLSLIRGDLDWIVMKALEKDRNRRYETAGAFCADIGRFLDNEPVSAVRPSTRYRFRKFAHRNRAALSIAGGIAAILVAAIVVSGGYAIRANFAEKIATSRADEAEKARADAAEKNQRYRALLADAARSDRLVAEESLLAGKQREAFAYLARAIRYDGESSRVAAEKGVAMLDAWPFPPARLIIERSGIGKFSPDGKTLATAAPDNGVGMWDIATGKLVKTFTGSTAPVGPVCFSPDGTRLLAGAEDKAVRIWEVTTGRLLVTLSNERPVGTKVFSPDGTRFVTTSPTNAITIWDASSWRRITTLAAHKDYITDAEFSTDGMRVVTASADKTARVWDSNTGTCLLTTAEHGQRVVTARFSPDRKRIVTSAWPDRVRVWNVETGKLLTTLHEGGVTATSAEFSPDGTRILTASMDHTAKIWDSSTYENLATLTGHRGGLWSARFSRDGTRVVTASTDDTARVWETASGTLLATFIGHGNQLQDAQFGPEGTRVITLCYGEGIRVWDVPRPARVVQLIGPQDRIAGAEFSPDCNRIISTTRDATAWISDANSGKPLFTLTGHQGTVTEVRFSPDGQFALTASADKTARVWNALTGTLIAELLGHEGAILDAQFNASSTQVATSSTDQTARIWDTQTGRSLAVFPAHGTPVRSARWSSDENRIITAGEDGVVRVWEIATARVILQIPLHVKYLTWAFFSPDDSRIATSAFGYSRTWLWDSRNGAKIAEVEGGAPAFSPDGSRLVTAASSGRHKSVRISDGRTGRLLASMPGHDDFIFSVHFSSDSRRIVSGSQDRTVRLWDAVAGKLLATLKSDAIWDPRFNPDGSLIAISPRGLDSARIWQVLPQAAGEPPLWWIDFFTLLSHMRLDSDGALVELTLDEERAVREQLRAVLRAGANEDANYLRILARFILN